MKKNIVWLTPPDFTGGLRYLLDTFLVRANIDKSKIKFKCLTKGMWVKESATTYTWDIEKTTLFEAKLDGLKPDLIICNDQAALGYITQKYTSLALTRGSVYYYKGIPVIVIDKIQKTKSMKTGAWIMNYDMQKLKRWITGKQKFQPKFKYKVAKSKEDLQHILTLANNAKIISTDIETTGTNKWCFISCIGYAFLMPDMSIESWVIPFIDVTTLDGSYWQDETLHKLAIQTMKDVNACKAYKVLQNGTYDASHLITYYAPMKNYLFDTASLWRAFFIEAPKRIDFIASMVLDFYTYWKDESAVEEQDKEEQSKLPSSAFGMKSYWRYNALDIYYTLLIAMKLIPMINHKQFDWAKINYIKEFKAQIGPAFAGSMRGIKWNRELQTEMAHRNIIKSERALSDLRTMTGNPNFNPNSTKQVQELLYGTLKAKPLPRKGKSVGEPILKLLQIQHPLIKRLINQIWKVKKPANNVSKYGATPLMNGRYMYKLSASTTVTWRYASSQSTFWVGSNVQNIPEAMRVLFEPDQGYVLFDIDYAQSDAYFTAFETEDLLFIETMLSDDDTHCIHAEHFFKIAYEKLIKAKKNKEKWCTDKTTGVRSVTKKAVYGANYMMAGYTLFITMGYEAALSAAKFLGYKDTSTWDVKRFSILCGTLIESYFKRYKRLPVWLDEMIDQTVKRGGLATCYGNRTRMFFGDIRKDNKIQRELASYFGQGGTAGNINEFLEEYYYESDLERKGVMFLIQVHDSIVGQLPIEKFYLLEHLMNLMERECTIHGRTFTVPVEAQVGFGWGARMIEYKPGVTTIEDIRNHELQWWKQWHEEGKQY